MRITTVIFVLMVSFVSASAQWAGGTPDENRADRDKVDRMLRDRHKGAEDRRRQQEEEERRRLASYAPAIQEASGGRAGRGSDFLGELRRADELAGRDGTSINREFSKITREDMLLLEKYGIEDSDTLVENSAKIIMKRIMKKVRKYFPQMKVWEKLFDSDDLDSHKLEEGDIFNFLKYKKSIDHALERASQNQCPVDIEVKVNEPPIQKVVKQTGANGDFAVWNDPRDGSIHLCVTDDRCFVRSATYRNGKFDMSNFEKAYANSGTLWQNGPVGHSLSCKVVGRGQ